MTKSKKGLLQALLVRIGLETRWATTTGKVYLMQNGYKPDYVRQSENYAAIVGTHAYLGERSAFVSCKGALSPDFRLQVLDGVWIVGKRYRPDSPVTKIVCVSREQAARIAVAHLMGE